jgi:hypothetical protein
MFYSALGRAAAIALATFLVFGLVFLREATSPSGAGYWTAMAAAPTGDLYLADEAHRELRLLHSSGGWERLGSVPPGIFRALAADGANLLLATEGKLYVSGDTGGHWRAALPGRFTAVSIRGSEELAGAWADALYVSHDSGLTWAKAIVPPGDTEFEAVVPGFAATLLGLLESTDEGQTWTRVPGLPDRMTALDLGQGDIQTQVPANGEAADWRGHVWEREFSFASGPIQVEPGLPASGPVLVPEVSWVPLQTVQGGIWSVASNVIATTQGVYFGGKLVGGPLKGREVTRLLISGPSYWAAAARGPIYVSPDGRNWRLAYQR